MIRVVLPALEASMVVLQDVVFILGESWNPNLRPCVLLVVRGHPVRSATPTTLRLPVTLLDQLSGPLSLIVDPPINLDHILDPIVQHVQLQVPPLGGCVFIG